MSDEALRTSVVMATYRRPQLLRRCLEVLQLQSMPAHEFEIIVVDDAHDDETRQLVDGIAREHADRARIRYLRPRSGRGPAVARNCGWQAAHAPVIAFTDDDTVPDRDWLMQGAGAMDAHPSWSALCGGVVVPPQEPQRPLPSDHELMTRGLEAAEFVTANAFVRRDALQQIGGFDERFLRPWREDSDLHFRLMQEVGPVGRWIPARVFHPVRAEPWGVCLRQQRNAFFDALLYKKHPRLYRERIRRVPPWDYYLIVALALAMPVLAWRDVWGSAAVCGLLVLALVLRLTWRRLQHTDHSPAHVWEMLATSMLIPFLSVYWRLRGALQFRVPFL